MKAELYQRAKELFRELVEASDAERNSRLEQLESKDVELAREVRSLLAYHTSQSLIAPQIAPKVRTRSTLSTTYQLRTNYWLMPAAKLAVALFGLALGIGLLIYLINGQVHAMLSQRLIEELSTAVDDRARDYKRWEAAERMCVEILARDPIVNAHINELLVKLPSKEEVVASDGELDGAAVDKLYEKLIADRIATDGKLAENITGRLSQLVGSKVQFVVWDTTLSKRAHYDGQHISVSGPRAVPESDDVSMVSDVLAGKIRITKDYAVFPIRDKTDICSAVCKISNHGIAERYQELLESWRRNFDEETYLVDRYAKMCSPSRYELTLEKLPLARATEEARNLFVRDPGVNLLQESASNPASGWPPTSMSGELSIGKDGWDVDGYRNYVGETVVGAWRWMPEFELGVAVERDYQAAYGLSHLLSRSLIIVGSLLGTAVWGLYAALLLGPLHRRRWQKLSELGPYKVLEVIGEGGMGRVYLAEHALLCRQSAVKVLTKGDNDRSVIGRFEREVQLASQLTHPNTIAIYDFGRNKDGVFYYAMEYIEGAHLGQLVEYCGPLEPGRCIFILQQLCRALAEAHQAGVVHRDIKPQNIMVSNRGGEPDFVKLFDYGLVKAFAPGVSEPGLQTKVVVGTPRFMAPERLDSPWVADPRVDVYSVGALAYFLLTSKLPPLVVPGSGLISEEQPGIETLDLPPSVVAFGGMLSHCLSVEPASRPSSMLSLLRELEVLGEKFPWSRANSTQWWKQNGAKLLQQVQKKRKMLTKE